ncbi:MAG TPA: hypothetical protein VHB48_22020 [Chitinophagaceae bacterium]|jgi:hypothetical protein|nr:hypothetical protein [Chitinophagaceae bacterium]
MINAIINLLVPKKARKKRLGYEDYIINNAPDNNFGITGVNNIEILKTFPLEEELYARVAALIKQGNIQALENMTIDNNLLEDLTLITFTNQAGEPFAAIIYDSYEVWQEPVVVEVFKLS